MGGTYTKDIKYRSSIALSIKFFDDIFRKNENVYFVE